MASAQMAALASCRSNCDVADAACMAQCGNTFGASSVCVSGPAGCPPGNTACTVLNGKCQNVRGTPQQDWLKAFNAASSISEGLGVACVSDDSGSSDCALGSVSESVLFASHATLDLDPTSSSFSSVSDVAAADIADFVATQGAVESQADPENADGTLEGFVNTLLGAVQVGSGEE